VQQTAWKVHAKPIPGNRISIEPGGALSGGELKAETSRVQLATTGLPSHTEKQASY
jgi:hypothetical protein